MIFNGTGLDVTINTDEQREMLHNAITMVDDTLVFGTAIGYNSSENRCEFYMYQVNFLILL